MLEKSGEVVLTELELEQIKKGQTPKRLEKDWGFEYNELRKVVDNDQFTLVNEENKEDN